MNKAARDAILRGALAAIVAPFLALYGVLVVIRWGRAGIRRVRGLGAALGSTLRCPNGHANPTVGRYSCGVCGGTYHGWIGRCPICGAGAGWTACQRCGASIRLPWERR